MHHVYKASIRTDRYNKRSVIEWYWDTREDAAAFIAKTVQDRKAAGQYVGAAEIQPILAAGQDSAFAYNYPDIVEKWR